MTTNTLNNLPPIGNRRVARIEAEARSATPGKAAHLLTRNDVVKYARKMADAEGLPPIVYARMTKLQGMMVLREAFDRKRGHVKHAGFTQDERGRLVIRYGTVVRKGGAA